MENREIWELKAAAWELLAFSLKYPEADYAQATSSGEWTQAVLEISQQMHLNLDERFAGLAQESQDLLARGGQDALRTLRVECTRLFKGEKRPACSPYEGVWNADDKGVPALLMVNPQSMKVERFCKACGMGRPEGTNQPLDHVVSECELLQYLAMLEADMIDPLGDVSKDALPGGSARAAYVAFLVDHAEGWLPRFAQKLFQETRHPAMKATALFLEAVMEAEHVQ